MRPLTTIKVLTPTTPITKTSSSSSSPIQYRIEERTRTVFVTTDVHPSQWDHDSLQKVFGIAETPIGEDPSRRNSAVSERQILVYPADSPNEPGYHSESYVSLPNGRVPSRPSSRSKGQATPPPRGRILFYHSHDPHYGFTNFSPHPVYHKGKRYPTSEHLFQSFKFQDHRPNLAEHIRTCSERPSVAFSEARRFQPEVRPDWRSVNIQKMDEALWYKFTQHLDLQQELLATGDAELVEDSDKDSFWGIGADQRGRNELGKALERLRAKLREDCQS